MDDEPMARAKDPAKARRAARDPRRPGAGCKAPPPQWQPVIDRAKCEGKSDCVAVCPETAITLAPRPA